ncbi:uncharacterized protein LOC113350880 [Papaver somniferum]|uniref:uncharacterized protein LOC113350880 n=1 Tax=Papaver somniferum TaxID=3469 RepID=UPI000E6F813F|nr:uncharacterized protein LOC113350880 [Papaver somniferum]
MNDVVERRQIHCFKVVDSVFEARTGIKLNLDKSTMVSIGADEVVDVLAKELGYRTERLPIKYLELPIGASFWCTSIWETILGKMEMKLASWKKKYLNKAGRLIDIKRFLVSLHVYFLSLF